MAYEWDFHPRLVPLGIWDETYLETRPQAQFELGGITYELSPDLSKATLQLGLRWIDITQSRILRWRVLDPQQVEVISQTEHIESDYEFEFAICRP